MNKDLTPGSILTNLQVASFFKCSTQGGLRRSHETNSLVIISNHIRSSYEDQWIGDTLHYTGMGLNGDQNVNFRQNRTLAESTLNGVELHLFEVFDDNQYLYQGRVKLAGEPYGSIQEGADGNPRNVFIFPLKVINGTGPVILDEEIIRKKDRIVSQRIDSLSDEELERKVSLNETSKNTGYRNITSKYYERDPYKSALAKRKANGKCQLCGNPAPFLDKFGKPFLEVHHIKWLSKSGEDTVQNIVALCPNCHRKMHILDEAEDRKKLEKGTILKPKV